MNDDSPSDPSSSIDPPAGLNANDLRFAAMYADLRRVARREAYRHGPYAQVSATTLVHEIYLDMAQRKPLEFPDAGRFLAYAARAMRGVVIDRMRARGASKRGSDVSITELDTQTAEELQCPQALQDISDALDDLAALEPDLARVVDLRFFCGFTTAEISTQLGISERTVQRQWDKARAILFVAMKD